LPKEVLSIHADNTVSYMLLFYQVLNLSINVAVLPELNFIACIFTEVTISKGYNA
jgi:hypothetical protein